MFPPAIIFVNGNIDGYGHNYADGYGCGDLDAVGKSTLENQLYIQETMTGDEFDARVVADPNYPFIVHQMNFRILVIRNNYRDYTNRQLADVVLFVKDGMASIEKNNCGPPGLTVPLHHIEIHQLLRYNSSQYTLNLVQPPAYPFPSNSLGGIFAIQSRDISGVHDVNPDNEYNNEDFIHRK